MAYIIQNRMQQFFKNYIVCTQSDQKCMCTQSDQKCNLAMLFDLRKQILFLSPMIMIKLIVYASWHCIGNIINHQIIKPCPRSYVPQLPVCGDINNEVKLGSQLNMYIIGKHQLKSLSWVHIENTTKNMPYNCLRAQQSCKLVIV